ncbi:MAG: 16S rRNA (uracil(1498)-N(3))-methyltransferase [Deltaproteobacteria bacterium]|nr:16S rRNA (uracil(1498)-N(3))-methyltransferase [Deltaproteobacteria bacterium]
MRYFIIQTHLNVGDSSCIAGDEANHIIKVLRKRQKDIIGFFDKRGFEYKAVITKILKKEVYITIIDKILSQTESNLKITIGMALLKEKKIERLIKTLTELGIVSFMPFISKCCVVKPDKEKIKSRVIRWKKIADEALKQCKRSRVPKIYPPVSFDEILNGSETESTKKIICYEEEKDFFNKTGHNLSETNNWFIIIGPEGGFTEEEILLAKSKGFISYGLGSRILRSETAAVAVVAIIQFLYGDMGRTSEKNFRSSQAV